MNNQTLLLIILVVLIALVVGGVLYARTRRSRHLQSRFGPEYERAVAERGGRDKAEADLRRLEKRVQKFDIRPLRTTERDRYISTWREVQSVFVDNPETAVTRADGLVGEVMQARGYPVGDFDQRAGDLSVDHPVVTDNYRAAHEIALRQGRGQATTEDLRQAMIHYRTLFDELTDDRDVAPPPAAARVDVIDRQPAPARRAT